MGEYVLIVALISVIIIGIVSSLGGYLKDSITKISCLLAGQEYISDNEAGNGYCK